MSFNDTDTKVIEEHEQGEPELDENSQNRKKKRFTKNQEFWNNVKVHPESGCKMSLTSISHEDNNPCLKEQKHSMDCILNEFHDRKKCQQFFDNYNMCQKFWRGVIYDRRKRGIKPHLPIPSERDEIKRLYFLKNN